MVGRLFSARGNNGSYSALIRKNAECNPSNFAEKSSRS